VLYLVYARKQKVQIKMSSSGASNQESNVGGNKLKDPSWDHAKKTGESTQKVRCKCCMQVFSSGIN